MIQNILINGRVQRALQRTPALPSGIVLTRRSRVPPAGEDPSARGPACGSGGECPTSSLGLHGGNGRCLPTPWNKGMLFPLPQGVSGCCPWPVALEEPAAASAWATCIPVPQILPSLFLVKFKEQTLFKLWVLHFPQLLWPMVEVYVLYKLGKAKKNEKKKKIIPKPATLPPFSNSPKTDITLRNSLQWVNNKGCFQIRDVYTNKCCRSVNLLGEKHRPYVWSSNARKSRGLTVTRQISLLCSSWWIDLVWYLWHLAAFFSSLHIPLC